MEQLTELQWIFDILLGLGVLGLAWRALASPDMLTAIVSFVAFGLLMAIVWVRLAAPDIALAEAAVGAGLTGALLMAAYARLPLNPGAEQQGKRSPQRLWWIPASVLAAGAVVLAGAVLTLPPLAAGLGPEVAANLQDSGAGNPVTAVLLNFRGYDTLLEMMVLLVALLDVWSLGISPSTRTQGPGPVLDAFSRLLAPLFVLVAAYLLWAGGDGPGGAFQAGAVLGAGGVVLLLAGWHVQPSLTALPLRLTLVAGPSAFILLGVHAMLEGRQLLEYATVHASRLILTLEAVASLSIGVTLAALFFGERPRGDGAR